MPEIQVTEIVDRVPRKVKVNLDFPFARKYSTALHHVFENVISPEECRQVLLSKKDGAYSMARRKPLWRGTRDFIFGTGAHAMSAEESADLRNRIKEFASKNVKFKQTQE